MDDKNGSLCGKERENGSCNGGEQTSSRGSRRTGPDVVRSSSRKVFADFQLNAHARPFVPLTPLSALPVASGHSTRQDSVREGLGTLGKMCPTDNVFATSEKPKKEESAETLRVRLCEQLENETYECMICCEVIRVKHWIWSCSVCFHLFHFPCLKKWSFRSVQEEGIWRCPGCQMVNEIVPAEYRCFCGKVANPRPRRRGEEVPHSCGEACRKSRGGSCTHKCTLPCHPGPCPLCPRNLSVKCDCGQQQKTVRCGTESTFKCTRVCGKILNCQLHECSVVCHSGVCEPCKEKIQLGCYCGKSSKEVLCTVESREQSGYACEETCGRLLECGYHNCEKRCHFGPCDSVCRWDPSVLKTCPCGKTPLSQLTDSERSSCTDPVSVCTNRCDKVLGCGLGVAVHRCKNQCHVDACAACAEMVSVRCRCGGSSKTVPCFDAQQYNGQNALLCERRCKKQRSCQLHKCGSVCCVDKEHLCFQVCGRLLNCGLHNCDQLCHRGKCSPCLRAGFDELYCECGHSVLHPPVPCGAKPPACDMPCSREHACPHPVSHNCHSEEDCPPCTFLTRKWCYGHHEMRGNIPCYLDDVSCGKPCGRKLACGMHFCMKTCHPGACLTEGEKCKYACTTEREDCGHPCKAQCHQGPCPETPCKTMVKVTCKCGLQKGEMLCVELNRIWNRNLAVKAMGQGEIADLQRQQSTERYKSLPCTEQCNKVERNSRLAEALSIENADVLGELSSVQPTYTDFLKGFAKENLAFVVNTEKALVELVQATQMSKTSSRSHIFEPMVRDRRRFIHEYAEYFLTDTSSYDQEPQRNVVVTAKRGKSCVPGLLLSSTCSQRKTVTRVAPPPMINAWARNDARSTQNNFQSLDSSGATKR